MAFNDGGYVSISNISRELALSPIGAGVNLGNAEARKVSDNIGVEKLPIAFSEFVGASAGSASIGFNFVVGYESLSVSNGTSYRVGYENDTWDIGYNPDISNPPVSTSAPIYGDVELRSEDGSVTKEFTLLECLPERFYTVESTGGGTAGEPGVPNFSDNYQFIRVTLQTRDLSYIDNGKWEYQSCEIVLYADPNGEKNELARQICRQGDPEFDMNVGLYVDKDVNRTVFSFDLGRNQSTSENGSAEKWFNALFSEKNSEVRVEFNFSS